MTSSSSILGCLKSGGGIDVKKACRYFQELDMAGDEQPKMARSKSSWLLELLSSPSSTLDPHWFVNQMDTIEDDLQDQLTSFSTDNDPQPRVKRPCGEQTMLLEVTQADGTRRKAKHSDTHWYYMYVCHPMIRCSKFHCLFRQQFCLPYEQYLAFLADAQEEQWFPRWGRWNATTPLELLVLGAFHYLGHGFTFDDLDEATAISCETHHNFFISSWILEV
jgi:hypothetical protein